MKTLGMLLRLPDGGSKDEKNHLPWGDQNTFNGIYWNSGSIGGEGVGFPLAGVSDLWGGEQLVSGSLRKCESSRSSSF